MPFLGNTTTSFNVDGNNINNGAITSEKIAAGAVVNADVNDTASIAGTKISADFGAQDLIVDTNLLFVDVSEDCVGIGTSSPISSGKLTVDSGSSDNFAYYQARGANSLESSLLFLTKNSSGTNVGGSIGHDGSTNTLYLSGTTSGATTQHVSINSSGNVGVGTTSPGSFYANADDLVVGTGSGHNGISIYAGTTSEASICFADGTSSTAPYIGRILYEHNTNSLSFDTGAQQRMIIDSSGRVGIGTSSPAQLFDAVGTGTQIGGNYYKIGDFTHSTSSPKGVSFGYDNANSVGIIAPYGTNDLSFWGYNGSSWGERVRFTASGNVGIGTTTPSNLLDIQGNTPRLEITDTAGTGNAARPGIVMRDSGATNLFFIGNGATGDSDLTVRNYASAGATSLWTNNTERLRVDSSGRLLLGTTTEGHPNADDFTIAGSGHTGITIRSGSTSVGGIFFSDATTGSGEYDGYIEYNQNTQELSFGSAADTQMRITANGSVLVDCSGLPGGSTQGFGLYPDTNVVQLLSSSGSTSATAHAEFFNPNGKVGTITTDGTSTSYNQSSDYRLKENVVDLDGAIDRVKQLAPKRFNFIADANKTVDGFLAHEAQAVVPEAVVGEKDAVDDEGNPDYQGIDQSKLVPLLTAALQEAITKIETLEAEVAALKGA